MTKLDFLCCNNCGGESADGDAAECFGVSDVAVGGDDDVVVAVVMVYSLVVMILLFSAVVVMVIFLVS